MATKLFVAGLAYALTDDQLEALFVPFGTVVSAKVIMDRETGRSKGFGFVEMSNDDEAKAAIAAMDGKEVDGRSIAVNEARPQEKREPRQGGGGFGGNRSGGGFGGGRGGERRGGGGGRRY